VGDRLLVKPEWEEIEPKLGQAVVILNPGMSFGTGHHATTLFCLKQLAECMPVGGGKSLLDAGAGSGILAISAAKLGYAPVEAWDFDPVAVGVARRNTEQNGLAQALAFENRDLTKMPPGGRQFDVVCANLMSELLVAEKSKLASWLAPTGRLVLAGVLLEQFPQVEAAFCGLGMELVAAESLDEWRSGAFQFSC
jgi:ribosomal protein L11 methyltransferase